MATGAGAGERDKVFLLSIDAHPGCNLDQLQERLGQPRSAVADRLDGFIKFGLVTCLQGTTFDDPDEPRVYDNIRLTDSGRRALEA